MIRERHQIDEPGIPSSIGEQGRDRIERLVHQLDPVDDFNFRHFRMRHMVAELLRRSLAPGTEAPDFELHSAEGARVRLRDLRGRPVLLHLVSYTCPVTRGGVSTMAELHELYGDRVTFIEMLVRQAHPGERHGPYHSDDQKVAEARDYQAEEHIPWLVLTDTLDGETQRAYLASLRPSTSSIAEASSPSAGPGGSPRSSERRSMISSIAMVSGRPPARASTGDRIWLPPSWRDRGARFVGDARR